MAMREETYGIRPDYVPNPLLKMEDVCGVEYWDVRRIAAARYYQFSVYRRAAALLRRERIGTLVDVGCGVAMKLEWIHRKLPNVRIVGIDHPKAVEFCRVRHPFGEWIADNIENPGDSARHICGPLVVCSDVIEHVLDPDRLLEYLRDRLAPGGWILLSTPERDLARGHDCLRSPNPAHVREWNRAELASYLASRGFKVLEHHLDYPVRMGLHRFALQEIWAALRSGRSLRYNQVYLLRPA